MKKITVLFYLLSVFTLVNAQAPDYDDLIVYYADGDFEKLLKVGERYTQNDKTRRDALPYLYLSKTNLEISKGGDLLEKYPRAFKDAIKFANKSLKFDSEGSLKDENLDHFTKCKEGIYELMLNYIEAEEYGRLQGVIPLMEKMDKNEVGTAFLKSVVKYRRGDRTGFRDEEKKALQKLEMLDPSLSIARKLDEYADPKYTSKKKIDRTMMIFGIEQYCKVVIEKGEKQKARDLIRKIEPYFKDDEKVMKKLNKYR